MEAPGITFPLPNVILGTSASDQGTYDAAAPRMRALAAAGWHTLWSLEPLLGEIDMRCHNPMHPGDPSTCQRDDCHCLVDWVIVGGESGHGARPMNEDWVRSIRDQCVTAGVPLFYKQKTVGGKKIGLPELEGKAWNEMPEVLR